MQRYNYKDIFKFNLLKECKTTGQFDLPILEQIKEIPTNVIPFNYAKTCTMPYFYYVHFFIDDYQFERLWNYPERYIELLSKFKGIIAPDFSTYANMPKAQQIFQVYKSRLISAYCQSLGMNVIPTVSWSDYDSLQWTLEGLPTNSVIAISTNGCINKQTKETFIQCYKNVIEILKPIKVIIIGRMIEEINSEIVINFKGHLNILQQLKLEV